MTSNRGQAVLGGTMYLLTHVTSIGAALLYASVKADPSLAVSSQGLTSLRVGAVLEVLLAIACAGTAVALLPVLRPVVPILAHSFFGLRVMEGAVIGAGVAPVLALTMLDAPDPETANLLLTINTGAFYVGQSLIISVNTLVIALAIWRSQIVFRGVAVLGVLGGTLVLTSNLAQILGVIEPGGRIAAALSLPVWAFELWFAGCLLLVGFRRPARPQEMA
ncbi:MAG: DUF4386 domain-containing protein, partial [Nostocoides sp.]